MSFPAFGTSCALFQEGDTNNAPKYNSQELDTESNFYYYNARHYSQEIARFVTADTVIDGEFDTQGWNRYAYTKNNPIEYKDPTGHDSILVVSNEIMEENKNDDVISKGPHQGEKYNTYKGYIYKDTKILFGLITLKTAKEKYLKDAANGNRANAEDTVLEITRNTQGEKNYDTNGSMPPTGKNKEYEVRLGMPSSNIDKYRIGDPKYWPKDKKDKKKNAENYIKNPERKSKRGWFNFDPWQNPGDLKGCLGISREDGKPFSTGFNKSDPNYTEKVFKKLNNYLEKVIPDLKEVNKNEGGEKVSVIVEDLFKKGK